MTSFPLTNPYKTLFPEPNFEPSDSRSIFRQLCTWSFLNEPMRLREMRQVLYLLAHLHDPVAILILDLLTGLIPPERFRIEPDPVFVAWQTSDNPHAMIFLVHVLNTINLVAPNAKVRAVLDLPVSRANVDRDDLASSITPDFLRGFLIAPPSIRVVLKALSNEPLTPSEPGSEALPRQQPTPAQLDILRRP